MIQVKKAVSFFAGFLLLAGRVGDLYGTRRVFLIGLTIFTGASLECGLAQSPVVLIVAQLTPRRAFFTHICHPSSTNQSSRCAPFPESCRTVSARRPFAVPYVASDRLSLLLKRCSFDVLAGVHLAPAAFTFRNLAISFSDKGVPST